MKPLFHLAVNDAQRPSAASRSRAAIGDKAAPTLREASRLLRFWCAMRRHPLGARSIANAGYASGIEYRRVCECGQHEQFDFRRCGPIHGPE